MKAKIILSLSMLIPFIVIFTYVRTTATDLAFRDAMHKWVQELWNEF